MKQLLFHLVEHLQENQKREQWREKQLKLKMKWGTSVYIPENNDDPSACICEYQGPWEMSHVCYCHQASTLTLREVHERLQEYGDVSAKEHTHCCDECHGSLDSVNFTKWILTRSKKYLHSSSSLGKAIWRLLRILRTRSKNTIPESLKSSQGTKKPSDLYLVPGQARNWSEWR